LLGSLFGSFLGFLLLLLCLLISLLLFGFKGLSLGLGLVLLLFLLSFLLPVLFGELRLLFGLLNSLFLCFGLELGCLLAALALRGGRFLASNLLFGLLLRLFGSHGSPVLLLFLFGVIEGFLSDSGGLTSVFFELSLRS